MEIIDAQMPSVPPCGDFLLTLATVNLVVATGRICVTLAIPKTKILAFHIQPSIPSMASTVGGATLQQRV